VKERSEGYLEVGVRIVFYSLFSFLCCGQ
jgi:hypothetical protein